MNATKERQAWCCLQVKLYDPCLSALCVPWCKKAQYKYSSFPFLSFHLTACKPMKTSANYHQTFSFDEYRQTCSNNSREGQLNRKVKLDVGIPQWTNEQMDRWMQQIIRSHTEVTRMWANANVMVALPNIVGALCSTPQSLADAHY